RFSRDWSSDVCSSDLEVKKAVYKKSDNKRLDAYLNLIPKYFINQECKEFWQYHYINAHLQDWGGKHVENIVSNFLSTSKNENYRSEERRVGKEGRNRW